MLVVAAKLQDNLLQQVLVLCFYQHIELAS